MKRGFGVTDKERLEFIKNRIKYLNIKLSRGKGKTQLIDDLIWLIDKAEKEVKRGMKK